MEPTIHCKFDEMVEPKKLKDHPKNRNKHGQDQIDRLAELYSAHGIRHPIIVSKNTGYIVAGHGRKLAAIRAGIKKMPVVFQEFENDEMEYAFIQSDNAIALWADLDLSAINVDLQELGPDFNIDWLGIKGFTLDMSEKEGLTDPDELPEQVEPVCKLGDIWKLGNHRLMCGDSNDIVTVEKLMNGEKIDMVFTDPPYGIGVDGQKKSIAKNPKHNRKEHEFRGWDSKRPSKNIFEMILNLEIPSIIFGGNYFADLLPPSRGWIYWDKGQNGLSMSDGELAWTNQDKPLRAITANRCELRGVSVHPTQKPISVVNFCLNYIENSKSVLDLFGGSGSTLIACEKTNRKCFMMELDPHYCDVIIQRWEKFTGQKAEKLDG